MSDYVRRYSHGTMSAIAEPSKWRLRGTANRACHSRSFGQLALYAGLTILVSLLGCSEQHRAPAQNEDVSQLPQFRTLETASGDTSYSTTDCAAPKGDDYAKELAQGGLVRKDCTIKAGIDLRGVRAEGQSIFFDHVHVLGNIQLHGAALARVEMVATKIDGNFDASDATIGILTLRHVDREKGVASAVYRGRSEYKNYLIAYPDNPDQYSARTRSVNGKDQKECWIPGEAWSRGSTYVLGSAGVVLNDLVAETVDLSGLRADGAVVAKGMRVGGTVYLSQALLRSLNLQNARIDTVQADGLVVGNNLRLFGTRIGETLDLSCASLDGDINAWGLHARTVQLSDARLDVHRTQARRDAQCPIEFTNTEIDRLAARRTRFADSVNFNGSRITYLTLDQSDIEHGVDVSNVTSETVSVSSWRLAGKLACKHEPHRSLAIRDFRVSSLIDENDLSASLEVLANGNYDGVPYTSFEAGLRKRGESGDANRVFLEGKLREWLSEWHSNERYKSISGMLLWGIGYGRRSPSIYIAILLAIYVIALAGLLFARWRRKKRNQEDLSTVRETIFAALGALLPGLGLIEWERLKEGKRMTPLPFAVIRVVGWCFLPLLFLSLTRYFS